MSVAAASPAIRPVEGMGCLLASMVFFASQDAMMKFLLEEYPVWMLIGVRGVISTAILLPLVIWVSGARSLATPLWPLHLLRAVLFAMGFSLFYAAFPFMGFAEVVTIFFSAPLMTAIFATLFLRETIGPYRGGALIVGFIGILIAIRPGADTFQWVAILPLICAVTYALSQIVARQIGERDSTLVVGLYTLAPSAFIVAGMGWGLNAVIDLGPEFKHLRFAYPVPSAETLPWLILTGLVGMFAYLLISRAYQIAPASLMAPFDYTYLPIAAILGYVLWGEVPPLTTFVGMALIIASGVFIGYREIVTARRARAVHIAPTAPYVADVPHREDGI